VGRKPGDPIVGVPLRHKGEFYGTLVCCDTSFREFAKEEVEHARTAARLIEAFL
jgi:GAF domain-containing protein